MAGTSSWSSCAPVFPPLLTENRKSVVCEQIDRADARTYGNAHRTRCETRLAGGRRRPDDDVLPLGEVEERLAFDFHRKEACLVDRRLGRPDRPGPVVDVRAQPAAAPVEAVALDEEVLQRAGLGGERVAGRLVCRREAHVAALALGAERLVVERDRGVAVGKAVREACRLNREQVRRVEAEEPDPGAITATHVGSAVELAEARHARERRDTAHTKALDPKRRRRDPG